MVDTSRGTVSLPAWEATFKLSEGFSTQYEPAQPEGLLASMGYKLA